MKSSLSSGRIKQYRSSLADASLSELSTAFAPFIPQDYIQEQGRGAKGRLRCYTPLVTFWAFLSQSFNPMASCREAVRKIQAATAIQDRKTKGISSDTSGYCQARHRLPCSVLQTTHQHLKEELKKIVPSSEFWHGRPVKIVDGTSASMPDTPENQAVYPQPSEQKPGCGFPSMKLVGIFSLESGSWDVYAKGDLHDSERTLFRSLFEHFDDNDICVGDRGFCSYCDIYLLKERGVDTVFRLGARRTSDFRKGKHLGKHDHLIKWQKPYTRPKWISEDIWEGIPETMTLREVKVQIAAKGFRVETFVVVTTLLDPIEYPSDDLAEIYLRRWSIELYFRDIKISMAMDIFRCKTPEMVHKELLMHILAYNLIRLLMINASNTHAAPLTRLSFKGTLDTLRQWLPTLASVISRSREYKRIFNAMLKCIADDLVPLRPNRSEPRAKKRRPKKYHLLNKPRHEMGHLPHSNRPCQKYKKGA
ncbi:MAG: IS4 family transposase [Kiritimatiellae bacterium]|nr:IS4 family transposase [Kiritimatiellia bacterium]